MGGSGAQATKAAAAAVSGVGAQNMSSVSSRLHTHMQCSQGSVKRALSVCDALWERQLRVKVCPKHQAHAGGGGDDE